MVTTSVETAQPARQTNCALLPARRSGWSFHFPPTPDQVRLIARAANAAGKNAESLYYLSEYRLMIGDLSGGIGYLKQALGLQNLQEIQRIRFEARIDFIRDFMTEEQLKRM